MSKETKIQATIIIIISIILSIILFFTYEGTHIKYDHIDRGNIVKSKNINLNDYHNNITIKKSGEYNITGFFDYSIIIDSKQKVILNLNNVTINSNITSAIANINKGELVINLPKDTINTLKDDGKSDYDGCIYSSGKLTIEGSGKLNIYGNQKDGEGISTKDNNITINGGDIYIESKDDGLNTGGDKGGTITINDGNIYIKAKGDGIDSNRSLIINGGRLYTIGSSKGKDAGIDTDGKFEINGGEVIAIGSDMLQNPNPTSNQKYISFNLTEKISSGSIISIKNKNNTEIISFTADENFSTLIISNNSLIKDTYYLYVNGTKTEFSTTTN